MGFFSSLFGKSGDVICAPVAGKAVPISQVSDPTFGEEILGKGVAIIPSDGKIVAPCDATVDMMFDTGHAVSLVADFGAEILVHIGLDTVNLKGEHFTIHAKSGEKVTRGQLLMEVDLEAVKAKGYDVITPVVICNSGEYSTFKTQVDKTVAAGDEIIRLAK